MSNSYFQFKQFRIEQGDTAMKVSTDACIQGACTPILPNVKNVLDIGCGTGLLSLMLAQREYQLHIDAIELDEAAAKQAEANIAATPWSDRINVIQADVRTFGPAGKYDLIICNPPFFNGSLLGSNAARNQARHSVTLSQPDLFNIASVYLSADGYISVMLPVPEHNEWASLLHENHWHAINWLAIKDNENAAAKRIVSSWSRGSVTCHHQNLCIKKQDGSYTEQFIKLLEPFYLYL
jgi:tRNA1Val (adenine37-N6)-methyltransferase